MNSRTSKGLLDFIGGCPGAADEGTGERTKLLLGDTLMMSRRARKRKPVPQRTCVSCRNVRPKRELVRIVRAPEGGVLVDETGKRSGRGAYLCKGPACWESALSKGQLDRALRTKLTEEEIARLREYGRSLVGDQGSDEGSGSA